MTDNQIQSKRYTSSRTYCEIVYNCSYRNSMYLCLFIGYVCLKAKIRDWVLAVILQA